MFQNRDKLFIFWFIFFLSSSNVYADACSNLSVEVGGVIVTLEGIEKFCDDYRKQERKIQDLENRVLTCRTVSKSLSGRASENADISIAIPAGYTLTGGGCYSDTFFRKIVQNYPSNNRTWTCVTRDDVKAFPGKATVYAIGCKFSGQ